MHPQADLYFLSLDCHSPLLSRIFFRSENARIESRENSTPAQNGSLGETW